MTTVECPNCGEIMSVQDKENLVSKLTDIITEVFNSEISSYNNALGKSDAWTIRKNELLNTDFLAITLLDKEISKIKTLFKDIDLTAYVSIDSELNAILNKEFGIINISDIRYSSKYGRYPLKNLISSKLLTQNITDVDSTIDSTIVWLKEKFEIYI